MEDQKEKLSLKVLNNCRNWLYSLYPYLDGAFASLPYRAGENTKTLGTDGKQLWFSPPYLIPLYGENPAALRRGYLHILLHCLYLHPFRLQGKDRRLWNLACDLAVEQILRREHQKDLEIEEGDVRQRCFETLGDRPLPAEEIYGMLEDGSFQTPLPAMEAAFLFDDHSLWEKAQPEAENLWHQVLSYTGGAKKGAKKAGREPGTQQEILSELHEGTGDYRKYLKQFAVLREEIELDMDNFDYIYYNLGMERYGNLPFIEPLETREGHKLSQLVIAIDTSGSCSKKIVEDFLSETYKILSDRENFFRKMEVYLIQCDCMVQSVAVIHNRQEWKNYSREITIEGRGGTDFTPVFQYVDGLRETGRLRDLKALLYFTDGDGCYPREKPRYETAFVFLKPNEFLKDVPGWARKMVIDRK